VSVARDGDDFNCAGDCAPLADFAPYRYTLAAPKGTAFHLSSRRLRGASSGNHAVLLRRDALAHPLCQHLFVHARLITPLD
jgi:hypothetical protein